MERILETKSHLKEQLSFFGLTLAGCGLITLGSCVKIPFYPVPFTLQTFAISLLALVQSPKLSFASAACYLMCGMLGLPVFGGHANSLWMTGKCAGYLVAFPLAAYLSSALCRKIHPFLALICGQLLIYFIGFIGLMAFFGPSTAWIRGVVFFIPSDLLKNMLAISVAKRFHKWRNQ